MSSSVNVPEGAIWMHEAVVRFKLDFFTDHLLYQFFQLGLVIRMNPLEQFFELGQTITWIETLNAVGFLRPILDTDFRTPCPASRLAEFLRLGEVMLAAPQLLSAREQVAVRKHARQRVFQAPGDLLEEPALRCGPDPRPRALVQPEQVRP